MASSIAPTTHVRADCGSQLYAVIGVLASCSCVGASRALRLQPAQVCTCGVARINEVTVHLAAELSDGGDARTKAGMLTPNMAARASEVVAGIVGRDGRCACWTNIVNAVHISSRRDAAVLSKERCASLDMRRALQSLCLLSNTCEESCMFWGGWGGKLNTEAACTVAAHRFLQQ